MTSEPAERSTARHDGGGGPHRDDAPGTRDAGAAGNPGDHRGRFTSRLFAACAVGLVLRVAAVALVPTQPVSDYWSYLRRAENILATGTYGVRPGRPDATWPPGYPLALAAALAVSGEGEGSGGGLAAAKALNVLLGVAAVALAGLAGRRLGGERTGLAAAWIAALLPRLVLLPSILASENLFLPLLLLWLVLLLGPRAGPEPGLWRNQGLRRALFAGLVLGLASLARIAGYLLGATWMLVGLLARRPLRRVAGETLLVLAAQHAVMLPWALRNQETLGTFSFLTSASGATLYIGNNPNATGRWQRAGAELPGAGAREEPGRRGRRGEPAGSSDRAGGAGSAGSGNRESRPSPGSRSVLFERDRLLRREALRWMHEEPVAAASLYLEKLFLLFQGEAIVDMVATAEQQLPRHALPRGAPPARVEALPADHPLRRNPGWLAGPVAVGYWLLTLLELGGSALLLRRAFGAPGPERDRWRAAAGAFLGTALYLVALGALFHGDPRFRWPASDALIPVAGLFVAQSLRLREKSPVQGPGRLDQP